MAGFEVTTEDVTLSRRANAGPPPTLLQKVFPETRAVFFCLLAIHCRLALYRFSICSVDVTGLVRIFDGMRAELCKMARHRLRAAPKEQWSDLAVTLSRPHQ